MGRHRGKHRMSTVYEKGIAIREWTNRPGYYVVDFQINNTRVRKGFASLKAAKVFCQTKRTEITNKGTETLNLTEKIRKDALAALRVLEGTNVTILAAAEDYVRRHPTMQGETVRQTCDRYLETMQTNGRRPLSIYEKTLKFNILCNAMGDTHIAAVDESDIRDWASSLDVSSTTKEAYYGAGMSLLSFCKGKLKGKNSTDQRAPTTWDAQMVSRLFEMAAKDVPEIVPSLTVLFFAGVRPHEMLRLTWTQIDLEAKVIRLTGEQTKTRTMRNVDLSANALSWLTPCRGSGPLVANGTTYRRLQMKLMSICGIKCWPTDVARHTFATMHYNAHQNAAMTMAQLGHFGNPQTFVTHYKGVPASAADVKAFWAIVPSEEKPKSTATAN